MPTLKNRLESFKNERMSDALAIKDIVKEKVDKLTSGPSAAQRSAEQGRRELAKPVTKMKAKEGPSKKIELLSRRNQDSALRKLEE